MADNSTPTSITVVSGLLIGWGTYSFVTMIFGWVTGMSALFNIDLGFVGIPIGAGVLSASQASRRWAIFFAGICLVTGAWVATEWIRAKHSTPQLVDMLILVLSMVAAAYVLRSLCTKPNRDWFSTLAGTNGLIHARSFVWTTFIVSAVFVALLAARHFTAQHQMDSAFAVDCRLVPVDSKTSQQLQNMSFSCEELSTTNGGRLTGEWWADPKGTSVNLQGVAFTPLNVVVSSRGYEPGTITIIPGLRGDQPVLLKPAQVDVTP